MLAGEGPPGPARPRLDLVGDQQDAGLGADVADLAQVSRRRDDHAGLALDGLDQEGDGVLVDRFAQGVGVAEADDLESRSMGAVVVVGRWRSSPW